MTTELSRNWWAIVLRGVLAVLFGVLAFFWPGITLVVLVLLFGAYAFIDGIFSLVAALTNRTEKNRVWVFFIGIVGILAGLIAFFFPGITAISLLFLIAAWAIVTGIFEILAAVELRREIENEWLLVLSGILSIVFGVLIVLFPGPGALGIIIGIAAYAIVFGIINIILGLRLRSHNTSISATATS